MTARPQAATAPLRTTAASADPRSLAVSLTAGEQTWSTELRSLSVPLGDHCADAAAVLSLLPAMRLRRPLELRDGASPRLLGSLPQAQDLLLDFDRVWRSGLARVAVSAPPRRSSRERAPGVACLFSGGVDSFYSLRKHESEITHLLFVHGFDVPLDEHELLEAASAAVNDVADSLGLQAIEVRTDLRAIYDGLGIGWEHAHGAALAAVALLFQGTIGRLIVPSTFAYGSLEPWGSHPQLDPLWGTEQLEIVHDGCETLRPHKLAALVSDDLAMRHLRVCWENRGGAYNCGECEKCVRTMMNLRMAGGLERCATLPDSLDLEAVRSIPVHRRDFLVENIAAAEALERPDPELRGALVEALRRHDERDPPAPSWGELPAGGQQRVDGVRVTPGELSFDVSVAGLERTLWLRTDAALTPTADAALAATLLPAMRSGGTLAIDAGISPRLLRTQRELQAIQRVWQRNWTWDLPPLREVEVAAARAEPRHAAPTGRVAAFFSGGVDSLWTVLDNPDLTDLIYVRGLDVPLDDRALGEEVERRLRAAAAAFGLPLVVVETNLRELSDATVPWSAGFGCGLAAVALLLAPLFDRVLIAGDSDYAAAVDEGANPLVDHLWSTESLEVAHAGGRASRVERTARVAADPAARDTLRVCWENRDGAYNCGRCHKCLMTMTTLEALGVRAQMPTFPPALDLEQLERFTPTRTVVLALWQDILDLALASGRPDLERPVGELVRRGLDHWGLPPTYRYRERGPFGAERSGLPARPATGDDRRGQAATRARETGMRFDVAPGGRHAVTEVRAERGELTFHASIAGVEQTIWFRTDAPVTPTADAALATCLLPALRAGGTLAIDAPVSPRLLRTQDEFQAIQRVWARDWSYGLPPLREVEVEAPAAAPPAPAAGRGVATFFSGGADSWATVLTHPEVTHLVFVRGMDIAVDATDLGDLVEQRLRAAAADLGKQLYVVETNLRPFSDQLVPWEVYYGSALAATALLLAPLFERFLMTGDLDYEVIVGQGAHPLVDHLWSTESLEIAHVNGRYSRGERIALVADDPIVQRTLRVCWKNPDGEYNCGRCRKCLSTMAMLELYGVRERVTTFPPELDLGHLGGVELTEPLHLAMWEEFVQLARDHGRRDLADKLATVIARADGTFDLPPSYRRRRGLDPDVGTARPPDGDGAAARADELAARLETVLNSRSWRLTAPLRRAALRARSTRGGG